MVEEIKPWEKPKPTIKPGGEGIMVTPVPPSPSSKPTTPFPKVPTPPPPPVGPGQEPVPKKKKEITTFFLLLAVIVGIFSVWVLISIVLDKIPNFLANLF